MKNKISMQDIANELGVSRMSVSKALNGQKGMSDELRKKIYDTAISMGYTLKRQKTEKEANLFIFLITKYFYKENGDFYNIIYYHMNNMCLQKSDKLILLVIDDHDEQNGKIPNIFNEEKVDGIFLVGQIKECFLDKIKSINSNIVAVDFYHYKLEADYILSDNFLLGYSATMFLYGKGHRSVGFVGDMFSSSSICDRYFGYEKALKMNGLEYRDEWIFSNNDSYTGAYTIETELPKDLPTAFVCHCERAAYFLKLTLERKGLRIPDDISLIAFDKTEISSSIMTNLTSFAIEQKEFASLALQAMEERINNKDFAIGTKRYVDTRLIDRGSVKDIS